MQSPDISGFVKPGKASVIFDGQFGSTGKGLAGAWVGEHNIIDWATTNASANAGHTSIIDGEAKVLFHIPSSYLTARQHCQCNIYINAGAIIDLDVLIQEIEELGIRHDEIHVNPNAAVILTMDRDAERDIKSSQAKIASTQKGCGASLARKVRRDGPNLGQWIESNFKKVPFRLKTVSLNKEMVSGASVVVEVPQGFSLSLNSSGFYPHTTSRDCTLQQGLADAGIAPRLFHKSMSVIRTYPIRVGNIMQGDRQIGFSGSGYPDQRETSWEELGQPEERTTVTKRVRRVFTFSGKQYEAMLAHSMPDVVFLNFCNYNNTARNEAIVAQMKQIEKSMGLSTMHYYGYSASADGISEYIR
jgi:adenylosuccinate synthase